MKITTVSLDLAKNVFQVHGVDSTGKVLVRRSLRRRQVMPFFTKLEPCLVGIEACGTSHFWGRASAALGHEVKADAAGVFQALRRARQDGRDRRGGNLRGGERPTMRFVAIKSPEQQSVVALHRTRDLLVRQRTQLVDMIRAQLAEFASCWPGAFNTLYCFTNSKE